MKACLTISGNASSTITTGGSDPKKISLEIERMRTIFSWKISWVVFFLLFAGMLFLHHSPAAAETVGVKVVEKEGVGQYLADGSGMTLYTFAADGAGVSNCIDDCIVNWPPFYVDPAAVVEGCEASDFGSITRDDGIEQTTYKGMPLYYFFNDMNPGDTNGDGVNGVWYVAVP